MRAIGIIPARMEATRFPGKPLKKIHGMPMIGHCYFRSKMCSLLDDVYVATCDQEIVDYINSIGGKAVMTKDTHERASDRVLEAMLKIEAESGRKVDVVVLIQGDEPMTTPKMIEQAVTPMANDPKINVINLTSKIQDQDEFEDPNEIKVVLNHKMEALYFSRSPIPSLSKYKKSDAPKYKQVCIIPFRREFLIRYSDLQPSSLEIVESIDMNRVLQHGYAVQMIETEEVSYSVDTQEDLAFVEDAMKNDPLMKTYLKK
jgi:3-deoxy-manno-octulosonate cytidylyltransferase (CMP-KDO synthetase)